MFRETYIFGRLDFTTNFIWYTYQVILLCSLLCFIVLFFFWSMPTIFTDKLFIAIFRNPMRISDPKISKLCNWSSIVVWTTRKQNRRAAHIETYTFIIVSFVFFSISIQFVSVNVSVPPRLQFSIQVFLHHKARLQQH